MGICLGDTHDENHWPFAPCACYEARMGEKNIFGVVLSGGGARGAYEAGVFHYIRTALPTKVRHHPFQLFCGSSVGSVNACYLASRADSPAAQGDSLRQGWEALRQEDIYKRDIAAISRLVGNSFAGVAMNILRKPKEEGSDKGIHFRGLVDTSPFPKFLQRMIDWDRMHRNIANQRVHGVSLTLTNMQTGRLEFFIEKHAQTPYTGTYPVKFLDLDWRHIMGSSAIPVLFPAVDIDGVYYSDGGLRLNTPMSPAIHMGANRVLVIGMHDPHARLDTPPQPKRRQAAPTLGEILGKILNAIFLDRLDYDLKQMERINNIISWGESVYGPDFLHNINQWLDSEGIEGDVASRGLKRLEVLEISPSRDVRDIFSEVLNSPKGVTGFSSFEKMLLKLLDVDMHRGQEFLSYFLFLPEYLQALAQLGYDDAKRKHDDIVHFLRDDEPTIIAG